MHRVHLAADNRLEPIPRTNCQITAVPTGDDLYICTLVIALSSVLTYQSRVLSRSLADVTAVCTLSF